MLGKANAYANKINRIMTGEPAPKDILSVNEDVNTEGKPVVEAVGEVKEEPKKEEEKAPAAEGLGALFG